MESMLFPPPDSSEYYLERAIIQTLSLITSERDCDLLGIIRDRAYFEPISVEQDEAASDLVGIPPASLSKSSVSQY